MRLYEFTAVEMQRQGQQLAIIEMTVMLDLDAICGLSPATVPSEMLGPDQKPVGTPACRVFFSGGQFTVRKTYQEMQEMWANSKTTIDGA